MFYKRYFLDKRKKKKLAKWTRITILFSALRKFFFTKIKFTQNGFKGKKWIVKMDFETS